MSNVVSIQRDEVVWQCGCGCTTFYLHADGNHECAYCGDFHSDGDWKVPKKEVPAQPETQDADEAKPMTVIAFDEGKAALNHVLKSINEDDVAGLAVFFEEGWTRTWGKEFDTDERREWLKRKLDTAYKLLVDD